MKEYLPFQELEKYQKPLLIIHGTNDSKVAYQDAYDVYQKLTNHFKRFEAIEGSEHGFHEEPHETKVTNLIVDFFKSSAKSFFTTAVRENCVTSAEDLVTSAEKLKDSDVPHIQYHLAALALEEIGKAELVVMQHMVDEDDPTNFESSSMDDHVRKLFWAVWGPGFGQQLMTKQQLDEYKGLAQSVHKTRLTSLYAATSSTKLAKSNVTPQEADRLLSLASARLQMEKNRKFDFDKEVEDKEELKWFLEATKDTEKRPLIFGGASHKKLVELKGDARAWIKWLKKQFDDNDAEIKKIIEVELSRQRPKGKEAKKPKYRIKVRLVSESHSIRKAVLKEWNDQIDFIQLDTDDKRTLFCTFTFSKNMPAQALWDIGWGVARSFAIALNIASRGFFWWHVEKDIEKYYEEIWDLEQNMRLDAKPSKRLALNWKELKLKLTSRELTTTSRLFAYVTSMRGKPMEQALGRYAFGVALTAKNDFHLRTEHEAFVAFYLSFKEAMQISGEWDGKSDLIEAAKKVFSKLANFQGLEGTLKLGEEAATSKDGKLSQPITLTEVFGMKMFTDLFFEIQASKMPEPKSKSKKTKK